MKQYLGIDVSSRKLNIHFNGNDFEIINSKEEIKKFIRDQKLRKNLFVVGAESTSRYHLLVQEIFVNKGFEFRLLNPILTGQKIQASIRKKKTDISDAKIITNLLMQGEGSIIKKEQLDTTRKTLLRTRKTIVDHKSAMKRLIKDLEKNPSNLQIKQAIKSIEKTVKNMDKCVKEIEANALNKELETENEELIRSIPGFATQLSAIVSCEVGDFKRFPTATQFKAYVGIDPKVTQSGGSLRTGKITKRGNVHLRSAFYLAAQVARCHDPELKEFYQKKKLEGKPTRVAIIAVARKLCERVFAVIKKGEPYEIRQPSFS